MGKEYAQIESVETKIYEWLKGRFLKERTLFSDMADLVLEAVKPLGDRHGEQALALVVLSARMFNDAEGSKQLLVWGLPDQAQPVTRDIIECSMMFRLFLLEPNKAKKWLIDLAQYQPGDIHATLSKVGVEAREYSLYGPLSHTGHCNLLASLSHVQETEVGEKHVLQMTHFGTARTKETEYFVQVGFLMLFFLLYIVLCEPLAQFYYQHAKEDVFGAWYEKVNGLLPRLADLVSEISSQPSDKTRTFDPGLWDLTKRKMRLEDFERVLNAEERGE